MRAEEWGRCIGSRQSLSARARAQLARSLCLGLIDPVGLEAVVHEHVALGPLPGLGQELRDVVLDCHRRDASTPCRAALCAVPPAMRACRLRRWARLVRSPTGRWPSSLDAVGYVGPCLPE